MPIHLPPISRRRFLSRTIAAGSGLLLSENLFAATKKTDSDFWALLSDTHLAADQKQLGNGINMAEHFKQVSLDLLSLPKRPAGVFITGDCAFNRGEMGDYATLIEMLKPMRAEQLPIHLALGNHDHRERFWQALQEEHGAKRPLEDRQVALVST